MEFTILDIAPLLSSIQLTITFMRGHNLLLQDYFCCGMQCSKVRDIKLSDQKYFSVNQQYAESGTQSEQTVFGLNQNYHLMS